LDRPVAVKIPRPYRLASPDQADLFRQEVKRVARLRHPGIVPVFDAGQDGEVFYIISDLIDGTNLAVRIAADRPSHRNAARIVAEVAYSRDGSRALTGSEDKTAALWDTETWSIKLRTAFMP